MLKLYLTLKALKLFARIISALAIIFLISACLISRARQR